MRTVKFLLKITGILLGIAILVAIALAFGLSGAGRREFLSTRNIFTNEDQVNEFYIGPVVFQIKNRFL